MPKGSKTHKIYNALRDDGMGKGKAAKIAQSKTGKPLRSKGTAAVHAAQRKK